MTLLTPLRRTSYTIHPSDLDTVLCHRTCAGDEQFLVRWKVTRATPAPAIYSWHGLQDLERCMHLVQTYVNQLCDQYPHLVNPNEHHLLPLPANRKRKSPDIDAVSRGRLADGLLTPGSSLVSRSNSPTTLTNVAVQAEYNGALYRRAGRIVARRPPFYALGTNHNAYVHLPTSVMIETATRTPLPGVMKAIREAFLAKLRHVNQVYLENKFDLSSPPLNFHFITDYKLRDGVYQVPAETYQGCQQCRPNMGHNIGCEYTQKCDCLEYAAVDEPRFQATNPELYAQYVRLKLSGAVVDTTGYPKRFPYSRPGQDGQVPQTLLSWYREERHAIYECNDNCKCGPRCKNRLVQKGRKVPLTIFKTRNRGWGVYCNEDLIAGEFIDTYLGEVITSSEADRREENSGQEKNSYLYTLDKFVGDTQSLTPDSCFVVDGQYMGGPTRFLNHSCEPNCRQYTVSYNKKDNRLYNLAFFAYMDIDAGTELTFDYMDQDEVEEEEAIRIRESALRDPRNRGKVPCGCGTRKCRGFLWERIVKIED